MMDSDLAVGDIVDVPGDMYGTVKFIGSVRGKQGRFVGVELSREFAAKGKNDGDVDGTSYFDTSIPGAGIFLPVHRAERRSSPALSFDDFPGTPTTPSYGSYRGNPTIVDEYAPPTPGIPKFSQSMGPGARPPSPQFKPKSRPSLPRPESPLRKQPTLAPTPARNFSMSHRGSVPPKLSASPAPPRSVTPRAASTTRGPAPSRPYSRNGSRLGHRDENPLGRSVAGGGPPSFAASRRSPSRQVNTEQDDEIRRLYEQLQDKDRQLKDQAESLAEMDASLKEIQSLIPSGEEADGEEASGDVAALRQALREKNDKIQSLVAEFDAHRADFRSTIDTLELASAETERVYEARVGELLAELQELRDLGHGREEVEQVAQQLRSLEELVAELEDGLEDARRGEAEARGEVEFLRGEVERGRSELRREREKAAKALQGAKEVEGMQTRDKDMETKDDEIRGLKAIIHSLSSGPEAGSPIGRNLHTPSQSTDVEELGRTQAAVQQLEREKSELQGLVERKAFREEELERAIEQLRRAAEEEKSSLMNDSSLPSSGMHRRIKTMSPITTRHQPLTAQAPHHEDDHDDLDEHVDAATEEEDDHDHDHEVDQKLHELDLNSANGGGLDESMEPSDEEDMDEHIHREQANGSHAAAAPPALANDVDADKWCALCEKDGHLAFDCPEEL
ncbi:hypothetical protein AAFC00_001789 [Neodothiora populina]|uniref:CAP-Gly domain-containing protein n=1 Tax=Neodothiora populina TaxID=2781224 RepID=A0ABR3PQ46_9PEZI